MLGSHNSFSYLKPEKWWMRIFNPWAKCQSKTLEEQYRAGVRVFDIRVRWKDDRFYLVHNLMTYKCSLLTIIQELDGLDNIKVRVCLDMRKEPPTKEIEEEILSKFKAFVDRNFQPCVIDCIVFWNWKHLEKSGYSWIDKYGSVAGGLWKFLPPRIWAWFYNDTVRFDYLGEINSSNSVVLMDFV